MADRKKEFHRRYEELKTTEKYSVKSEVIINRKPICYLLTMANGNKYRGSRQQIADLIEQDLNNDVEETFLENPYYPLSQQDPFYFPNLGKDEE